MNKEQKREIDLIAKSNNGMVDPEVVIKVASNEKSSLHPKFEWDDSVAGHQHRLWQARKVIASYKIIMEEFDDIEFVPKYVSLDKDKGKGGYRCIKDVMSDKDFKLQLMQQAKRDLTIYRDKYKTLTIMDKYLNRALKELDKKIKEF